MTVEPFQTQAILAALVPSPYVEQVKQIFPEIQVIDVPLSSVDLVLSDFTRATSLNCRDWEETGEKTVKDISMYDYRVALQKLIFEHGYRNFAVHLTRLPDSHGIDKQYSSNSLRSSDEAIRLVRIMKMVRLSPQSYCEMNALDGARDKSRDLSIKKAFVKHLSSSAITLMHRYFAIIKVHQHNKKGQGYCVKYPRVFQRAIQIIVKKDKSADKIQSYFRGKKARRIFLDLMAKKKELASLKIVIKKFFRAK